jgi:glutaredoxin
MSGAATRVTLLTQDDCTFCDHAKEVLARVGADYPLQVDEIGLDTPAGQALAVGEGVFFAPGVLLDDALFSHGRLSEKKLRRTLDRRRDARSATVSTHAAPPSDRSTR